MTKRGVELRWTVAEILCDLEDVVSRLELEEAQMVEERLVEVLSKDG